MTFIPCNCINAVTLMHCQQFSPLLASYFFTNRLTKLLALFISLQNYFDCEGSSSNVFVCSSLPSQHEPPTNTTTDRFVCNSYSLTRDARYNAAL